MTTAIVAGLLVFFFSQNQFLQKNNDIAVAPLQIDEKTSIQFPYTDDNSGENIIIKTDKKDYYGVNSSDVYISITNTRDVVEKAVLLFYFPKPEEGVKDEKLIPRVDTLEQYGDSNSKWKFITFFKENIKINPKLLSVGLKKRESIPQTLAVNIGVEIDVPANQTVYFKSKIKYPEGSQGEFWIETIGTEGGYGLLDPTYFGTTVSSDTKPGWYDPFTYRKKFTIPSAKVSGGSNLSNFPVLISHTDPDIRITSFGGKSASGSGEFIFTSSDGTTSIPYEIERYSSSSGEFIGWVNVTTLSATADTELYMYYGGAAAGAATNQNKTGTWDSNYVGVWHLPNGRTLSALDSTSNANNGTVTGATANNSKIDGGGSFDGSSQITTGTTGYTTDATWTLEGWAKSDIRNSAYHMIVNYGDGTSNNSPLISENASNNWNVETWGCGSNCTGSTAVVIGKWTHVVGVGNTGTITLYLDGVLNSGPASVTNTPVTTRATIGASAEATPGYKFDGSLDEIRVSKTNRSTGWIATEYNNQVSPRTFYTIGAEQNRNPSTMKYGTTASSDTKPGWYISGSNTWKNRIKFTIPSKNVSGGSDLSSFPMLLLFTESDIKTIANGGRAASGSGEFVVTSSNGTTVLPHEIETYSATTGQFIGWVNVTTLSATQDTVMYMYYNGPSSGATNQNKTGTWNSAYVGVWHLKEATGTNPTDSTSNALTLTQIASPVQNTGKINGSLVLNGSSQCLTIADTVSLNIETYTIQMWANTDLAPLNDIMIEKYDSTDAPTKYPYRLQLISGGDTRMSWNDGVGGQTLDVSALDKTTWYSITMYKTDDGEVGIKLNNSISITTTDTEGAATNNSRIGIGCRVTGAGEFNASGFDGSIDEIRISNTVRSAGWIATEYNNQVSPRTFHTIGRPESMTVSGNSGNEAPGSIKTK